MCYLYPSDRKKIIAFYQSIECKVYWLRNQVLDPDFGLT